jgi:hypothetical protein
METSPHEINTLQVCTKADAIAIFYPFNLCTAANLNLAKPIPYRQSQSGVQE